MEEPQIVDISAGTGKGGGDARQRRSKYWAIVSSIAAVVASGCLAENMLNLVALKLGATDFMLGLLSLFMFLPFTFSVFTLSSMERIGKRRLMMRWWWPMAGFSALYLLLPVLAEHAPLKVTLGFLFVIVTLRSSTNALGITAWMPLIHDVAPEESTGRFFAQLRFSWLLAGFIFLTGCGFFLSEDSPWWKYQVIFLLGVIMAVIRVAAIKPIAELPLGEHPQRMNLWQRCRELMRDNRLRMLLFYYIGITLASGLSRPYRMEMLKNLGYGDNIILLASGAMQSLGAMITLGVWGRLADKHGNRSLLSISTAGLITVMACWLLVEKSTLGAGVMIILYFLEGALIFGNGIATTRVMFHSISEKKQYLMSLLTLATLLFSGIGPFIGGIILWGLRESSFAIGALHLNKYQLLMLVNVIAYLWPHLLRRRLRTEGEAGTVEVISFMAQSLRGAIAPFMRIGNSDKVNPEKHQESKNER